MAERITTRDKDFAQWFVDVIIQAKLADYSPVKGCMVIRPNGYSIWEKIRESLDGMFKETGHVNAYFPMFIPESFLKKEAEHVEGFAPECAVVTHGGGKKLEEPLIVRPTSETIINAMYSKWIQSYRDLPVLINQWANVVRWEMRTRLFLRTTEFLWQEGHTCHETEAEAREETLKMLGVYRKFAEEYMAIPVIYGIKTESEKFAGAVETYSIEMLMQDGKALQGGTSHLLGQNFAKPFNIKFQDRNGKEQYVWQTSWGVSTRLIGALIMVHSDDKGLVIPPRLAPIQCVIVPIFKKNADPGKIKDAAYKLKADLFQRSISVKIDDSEHQSPGFKFHTYEIEGVPVRVEIGPRDLESGTVTIARRDMDSKESVPMDKASDYIVSLMDTIQKDLFQKAKKYLEQNTKTVDSYDRFKKIVDDGGMFELFWCGGSDCEEKIKNDTKATVRCISTEYREEKGSCICCGKPANRRTHFAKAH
ncbi:MAG: proline--tRNA ligase [Oligoflexia bacterium]|nr:proline--tRNA ligase [Oligoflexia bacterium]